MARYNDDNDDDDDDRNIYLRNEIPICIRSVGIPCAHLDGDGDDDDDDYFNSHGDGGDEDDIGPPGCLPGAQ